MLYIRKGMEVPLRKEGVRRWEDRHQRMGGAKIVHLTPKYERKRAKKKKRAAKRSGIWVERNVYSVFREVWLYFRVILLLVSPVLRNFSEDFLLKIEIFSKIL